MLNLQGLARSTQDLDVFVAATDENIARLRAALTSVYGDPHIAEITAEDLQSSLSCHPVRATRGGLLRPRDRADAERLRRRFGFEVALMPVYKYRDVADMPDATWYEPGDQRLFAAIRATWHLAATMAPARFPPGVYKHTSIEAADALREQWDQAHCDALHTRRAASADSPNSSTPPETA